MSFRSGGKPRSVEDDERDAAERHLAEVRAARIKVARSNPRWTEIDAADLVQRPLAYWVSVDTDAYFTHARGAIFERDSSTVIATHAELTFYVEDGEITFLERQLGCWSDVVARRATAAARGEQRRLKVVR